MYCCAAKRWMTSSMDLNMRRHPRAGSRPLTRGIHQDNRSGRWKRRHVARADSNPGVSPPVDTFLLGCVTPTIVHGEGRDMHTVGSCFPRLLAALLLGSMVVSIASAGAPFGGDDPGCLPDAGSASCQLALTKAIGKAYACLIKCHGNRASGKLADGAAEVACETGDPKKSCKAKYDRATGAESKLEKTCPAGFDAGYRAALFTAAGTDVAGAVGRLFPCGTVTTTTS